MLVNKTSFFCPVYGKFGRFQTAKSSLGSCKGNNSVRIKNIIRGSFGSERKGKTLLDYGTATTISTESGKKGIGIPKYFEGKNIFITGGTGLLGKVIVEKLLRSTPVGKIYVLVRAKDQESASDRLEKELINSDLFKCLQEKHGKYYQGFVREKVIPVVGNICEPNLGMDTDSARAISDEVNIVIESAAITTLDERYDLLLDTNVNGPQRLMMFAKTCKNLELFVHISTAYVNGEKEGLILENPWTMGENAKKESGTTSPCFLPQLNIGDEINLTMKSCTATTDYGITLDMKRIGMKRANLYGWHNTYQLTKAMGEMVMHESRKDIPILIVRPSVIESCYMEPVPGWIQGVRMFDPVIISYGRGLFPAFLGYPDTIMDFIPLDIVANGTIAAIAKHGSVNIHASTVNVYHIASSAVNPLRFFDFFEYIYEYFNSKPLSKRYYCDNLDRVQYFDNFDDFSKYTREEIHQRVAMSNLAKINAVASTHKLQKQCKAMISYVQHLSKLGEFLGFYKARFDVKNTQKLWSEMSDEEHIHFAMDIPNIDWRKYFQEIHIPGLRKNVLND